MKKIYTAPSLDMMEMIDEECMLEGSPTEPMKLSSSSNYNSTYSIDSKDRGDVDFSDDESIW